MTDEATIIKHFESYISRNGGGYPDWYVGIAEAPKNRLFEDHNVGEKGGKWIYEDAGSRSAAETVEAYFVKTRSTKGGLGGGSDSTKSVYAYRIGSYTKE